MVPIYYFYYLWKEDYFIEKYIEEWFDDVQIGEYSVINMEKNRLIMLNEFLFGIRKMPGTE